MDKVYTLSALMTAVSQVVESTFDEGYWITAELSAVHQKSKGYWVLELQESDETGQKKAQTQALVWANAVPRVIYRFQQATKQALSAGMKVKIHVQVGFHPQWGFRLTCDNIDPQWTLGEAEQNNQRIKDLLVQEGLWGRQATLSTPIDFYKVGVIAPDNSAGLDDFLKEAHRLTAHGLTMFEVRHAPFEGPNASKGITHALTQLCAEHPDMDAICLVRGGGAAGGIAWLNDEHIVRAVCQSPIPVISGIGHERDHTLVDEVAHVACGTPSKTIEWMTHRVIQQAQQAQQHYDETVRLVEQRVQLARSNINDLHRSMMDVATTVVQRARQEIEHLVQQALQLGPQQTLQRGYVLVKETATSKMVASHQQAITCRQVTLVWHDGSINVVLPPPSEI